MNKINNKSTVEIGSWGEDKAVEYLKNQGYRILCRNFHSKFGEIDIIAVKNKVICFIEVKTRKKISYGLPSQAVNYGKQKKLILTAEYFLTRNYSQNFAYRFDIIEVFYYNSYIFSINHIEGAFEL